MESIKGNGRGEGGQKTGTTKAGDVACWWRELKLGVASRSYSPHWYKSWHQKVRGSAIKT